MMELSDSEWFEYAESAFDAYCRSTNMKAYNGRTIPDWSDLPSTVKMAWVAAVKQVFKDLNVRPV